MEGTSISGTSMRYLHSTAKVSSCTTLRTGADVGETDTCIYSFENDYSYLDLLYEDSLLDEESRRILKTVNDDTNGLIIKYHLRNDILN